MTAIMEASSQTAVHEGDNLNIFIPCGAWCFVFGLAGLGPNGAPLGCIERKGHDDTTLGQHATPHKTKIQSFGSPKALFTVTWTVETE